MTLALRLQVDPATVPVNPENSHGARIRSVWTIRDAQAQGVLRRIPLRIRSQGNLFDLWK